MNFEKPPSHPISVQAVEAVRLTCKHCGVAIIMPIKTTRDFPQKCFNCCHEFPAQPLSDFMREFRYMQDAIGRADISFLLHLEAKE